MIYESDNVIGMFYPEAMRFIERNDRWEEVVGLVTDEVGAVVAVMH